MVLTEFHFCCRWDSMARRCAALPTIWRCS